MCEQLKIQESFHFIILLEKSYTLTHLSPFLFAKVSRTCVSKLWAIPFTKMVYVDLFMVCSLNLHVSLMEPMWMPHRCHLPKASLKSINRSLVSSISYLPHLHCYYASIVLNLLVISCMIAHSLVFVRFYFFTLIT